MGDYICVTCGSAVGYLEVFPGPLCLGCYSRTDEARCSLTSDDVRRMWNM